MASPDDRVAVIYEPLGTKGVVLKNGETLRQIDRASIMPMHMNILSPCSTNRVDGCYSHIAPKAIVRSNWRRRAADHCHGRTYAVRFLPLAPGGQPAWEAAVER
jgi:hypothetical protein